MKTLLSDVEFWKGGAQGGEVLGGSVEERVEALVKLLDEVENGDKKGGFAVCGIYCSWMN